MRHCGRGFDLALAFAAIWVIPYAAAWGADLFRPITRSVDPAGLFFRITVHHLFQLALTVLLMKLLFKNTLSAWGFNSHERRLSLTIFGWFCLVYFMQVFLLVALPDLASGKLPGFHGALTAKNATGILSFQFLLSGTCEEPLFRGFVMTLLARSWTGGIRVAKVTFPFSGLWATLFFMTAHVEVSLSPFSISAPIGQQLLALELGLYYAAVFGATRSLLGPILSHGFSNGVLYLVLFTGTLLMR